MFRFSANRHSKYMSERTLSMLCNCQSMNECVTSNDLTGCEVKRINSNTANLISIKYEGLLGLLVWRNVLDLCMYSRWYPTIQNYSKITKVIDDSVKCYKREALENPKKLSNKRNLKKNSL